MITIDDMLGALVRLPFFGRRIVESQISRCHQRHKCDTCGEHSQVVIGDIVKHPLAILSEQGRRKFAQQGYAAATSYGASVDLEMHGFACPKAPACSGRLGFHVFPEDSTGGSKSRLRDRMLRMFALMPHLMEGNGIDAVMAGDFAIEDIHFVD